MAWQKVNDYTYTGIDSSSGNVHVTLYYNDSNNTPEELQVKFEGSGSGYTNGYYILLNPGSTTKEKLGCIKRPKEGKDGYASCTFTVTKNYKDSHFTIPFWICNTGSVAADITNRTVAYTEEEEYGGDGEAHTYNMYDIFRQGGTSFNNRHVYKTDFSSTPTQVAGEVANDATVSSMTIKDNGNNTATITVKCGGTNNPFDDAVLYYTTDGSTPTAANAGAYSREFREISATGTLTTTVDIPGSGTVIKAYVACNFYYNTCSKTANADVKYHVAPSFSPDASVSITGQQYKRLVPKDSWDFCWSAAQAGNADSPINGYDVKIEVKKSDENTYIPFTDWCYHDGDDCLIMDPLYDNINDDIKLDDNYIRTYSTYLKLATEQPMSEFSIQPGDKIKVSVRAYTNFGPDDPLTSSYISSAEYDIKNAGMVCVKTSNSWMEGQVFIKDGGVWHEAEAVYIKNASNWLES